MKMNSWLITGILLFSILLLGACSSLIPQTGVSQVNAAATQRALIDQAVQATATTGALQTQVSELQTQVVGPPADETADPAATAATAPPADTAVAPTATVVLPTATAVPPTATPTLVPTATAIPPTATPAVRCNVVAFVGDVTISDGTVMTPGRAFTKTWRVRNVGSCTWTPSYDLIFIAGDSLGAPAVVDMPGHVAPGETVDLSVNMTAPASPGRYRGFWQLRDASGALFGLGSGDASLYVDIQVQVARVDGPLDFAALYCSAEWSSGAGPLPCPGSTNDSRGYVRRINNPTLESGYIDDEPVLLTHPQMVNDGLIRGVYPPMRVENGMSFVSIIGCAHRADRCDVLFQLEYQLGNGPIQTLATWHEIYDEQFRLVEHDLSGLQGYDVRFILTARANGSPADDRAQWLAPRIVSPGLQNIIEDAPRSR